MTPSIDRGREEEGGGGAQEGGDPPQRHEGLYESRVQAQKLQVVPREWSGSSA